VVHAGEMEKGVGADQGGELSLSLSLRDYRGERGEDKNGGGNDGRKETRQRKRKRAES
jgi:hypothetical protein